MLPPRACFLFTFQTPHEKKLNHNQLRINLCSLSLGENIILQPPISATCDKTEDVLLARSACKHPVPSAVAAALKCNKECLLFSFTKITVLLLFYLRKKKKSLSSLQFFYLLKSYANNKGNYVNCRVKTDVFIYSGLKMKEMNIQRSVRYHCVRRQDFSQTELPVCWQHLRTGSCFYE